MAFVDVESDGWPSRLNRRYVLEAGIDASGHHRSEHAVQGCCSYTTFSLLPLSPIHRLRYTESQLTLSCRRYRKRPPSSACAFPSSSRCMRRNVSSKNSQPTRSTRTTLSSTSYSSPKTVRSPLPPFFPLLQLANIIILTGRITLTNY